MNAHQAYALAHRKAKSYGPDNRITRDAFGYLEPHNEGVDFAQCSTCVFRVAGKLSCALAGGMKVEQNGTCWLYVEGKSVPGVISHLSTEEIGYTVRKVRCENCKYGGSNCALYAKLNNEMPAVFNLETKIRPKACCNANTPK